MFSAALTRSLEPRAEKPNTVRDQISKANEQNILGEACGELNIPFHSGQ